MNKKTEALFSKRQIRFLRVYDLPQVELYQGTQVTAPNPRHEHQVFGLSVGEAGVGIHQTRKEKFHVTPGSLIVVNIGEAHSGGVPDGHHYSSRSIRIDPIMLNTLIGQITGHQKDTLLLSQPVVHDPELAQSILNLYEILVNSRSRLSKEYLLLDILAKLYSRHSREDIIPTILGNERNPVSRVCDYLKDCFNENVSLDKLAEIAALSPFHLARVFVKETGVPPHSYQLQIRLKKATDLLAAGRPIAEVALETGFCDQSHFQRAFKKKFGITPGQYNQ